MRNCLSASPVSPRTARMLSTSYSRLHRHFPAWHFAPCSLKNILSQPTCGHVTLHVFFASAAVTFGTRPCSWTCMAFVFLIFICMSASSFDPAAMLVTLFDAVFALPSRSAASSAYPRVCRVWPPSVRTPRPCMLS